MPAIRVRVAALLYSYTGSRMPVEMEVATVGEALSEMERRFPGLRFRVVDEQGQIRPHMNVFLNEEKVGDLTTPVPAGAEIYIVGALSGG